MEPKVKIVERLGELPKEFVNILEGIGDRKRFEIVRFLMTHGDCTFEDIVAAINGNKDVVKTHIRLMLLQGVVQRRPRGEEIWIGIAPIVEVICAEIIRIYNESTKNGE